MIKRKKKYLILFFILFVGILSAQQKTIDSLELQLLNTTNGKSRAENLIQLGHYYSMTNPDKGIERLNEAIELTMMDKDSFRLGSAFGNKGKNHISLGNDSLAFIFYDRAEIIFRAIDSTKSLSKLMFNKGLLYSERSNYQSAAENVQNALEIFTANKDTLLMGYSLGTLGYYKIFLGDYTASMEAFLKGISLLEQINQEESILYASALGNMGILYQKLSKPDIAIELHQKAMKIFKKNDNQHLMSSQYTEIGNIYEQKEKFKKALINYEAAYNIAKKSHNIGRMASEMGNIGLVYSHLKNYDNAITYLDSAMVINKDLKDYGRLSINYHNKGEVYYHQKEILKARNSFDSSLVYAKKIGDKRMIYEAKLGVSQMASIKGDYKTAFNVLDQAVIIRDTLFSDDKREELATLKAKYEYDKEKAVLQADFEKNKAIAKTELKQQIFVRNVSIGLGIFSVLILVSGFTIVRRKKEAELNVKIVSSQLQTLKAQLNPHFIFNTLNSINDYIQRNEKEIASEYLISFSKMMRNVLDNSMEDEVLLSEEISFIENYIKLEQQRLDFSFNYIIDVDKDLCVDEILVPPALLQPFVENSIWHGLSNKENGILLINISKKSNSLIYSIDDNGIGFIEKEGNNKSFGSNSIKSKLELFNKIKGESEARVEVINKNEGVRVILQVPFSEEIDS